MRRASCLALAFLILTILVSGCAKNQPAAKPVIAVAPGLNKSVAIVGSIPVSFPLCEETGELNILIASYNGRSQDDVYVWQKYEEMTNVDTHWTCVDKSVRAEAVNNALMNKQNIDLILRCKLSANRLTQYGESGLLLDLAKDGMLEKYAPNCWAYLQAHPDTLASVMNPDGTIYALPQVNSGAELRVSRKLFVNKAWLERVNMELPTTTEEMYLLLKAFSEQDANGNGDPNDEIPLCSMDFLSLQEAFFGAFGLANRGVHNLEVDCDESTGKARLIAASEGYRSFLEYFNRLYSEKLLDNYIFTITGSQFATYEANDRVGVFSNTNLPANTVDNWVAIDKALTGPNGDKLWSAIRANFHSTGAAAIPATCTNPELCLRWLDYFWTDEGTLFYHMGIEGETFVTGTEGNYDYSPAIYEKMSTENRSFDDVVADYSPYPGGSNPTVEIAPYFMGGEMAAVPAAAARALFTYGPKEYWPSFTFTTEESARLNIIRGDYEKYCDSMLIKFITGTTPLSEWDSYVAQLQALNAEELLQIHQAAVDRYNALTTSPS